MRLLLRKFFFCGVLMLLGTDSGIPMKFHCQSTWNEFDVWTRELGVPVMDAIRSSTYWAAVFMGVQDEVEDDEDDWAMGEDDLVHEQYDDDDDGALSDDGDDGAVF
mgnify:CR=1 FL=1